MRRRKLRFGILLMFAMLVMMCSMAFAASNTIDTAETINLNSNLTITSNNYSRWYKFTIPSNGYVSFNATRATTSLLANDGYVALYTKAAGYNDLIAHEKFLSGDAATDTTSIGLAAGTYYIDVTFCIGSFRVNYTASDAWEKEKNSVGGTATFISLNKDMYGTFHYLASNLNRKDDNDWYVFNLTNPGKVSLQFTHPSISSSSTTGWKSDIYKIEGSSMVPIQSDVYKVSTITSTSLPVGLPAGTYAVCLTYTLDDNTAKGAYTLKVNYEQSSVWEVEPNNKTTTATGINLATEYWGSGSDLGSDKDVDYYKVSVPNTGSYTIRVTAKEYKGIDYSDSVLAKVAVLGSDGVEQFSCAGYAGAAGTTFNDVVTLNKGDYYLQVTPNKNWVYTINVIAGNASSTKTYKITFDSNEGSRVAVQYVRDGQKATAPTDPTKRAYVFGGWYTDNQTFQKKFDFNTAIKQETTLYAKWNDLINIPCVYGVKAKRGRGKITYTWKYVEAAQKLVPNLRGFTIQIATDSNFKNIVKVKNMGPRTTKFVFKGARRRTYYMRIRYVSYDGFSRWKVKRAKTK